MIRVLQLAEAANEFQTSVALSQLASNDLAFRSQSAQVSNEMPLAVRRGLVLRRRRAEVDLVHAWGDTALRVAAFAFDLPIVFSPTRFPDRSMIRWLRAIERYRAVHVIATTQTMHRTLVERGIANDRCHVISPGVDFSRINKSRGRALRETLGFTPDDRVILAVGESSRATDHARAVWAAVILHVLERRNRILIWGRGPLADAVARFAGKLGQPELCVVATRKLGGAVAFEDLLGAADVALVTNAAPAPLLPIALCMAAALPIVSVTDSTVCELLEDRHNALLCTSRAPRVIARRLMDMEADSAGQWARSDQGRAEAYERYSRVRFVNAMQTIYQSIANERLVGTADERR
jgi:glycosyltransferase involved in cell wall biosynthesis